MNTSKQPKAVLVTGTSTGIGRATALQLDQLGYQVFATVRNEPDAESLREHASSDLIPILLDVTDENSINQAEAQISQIVGSAGLWGLVNNAAVAFTSPLEYAPLDKMRGVFEANFFGVLALTQKFLPLLRQARGRIVNVSSMASIVVAPFHGPYSTSKLALNALSDALRLELRPNRVKVSLIIYGSVRTPIWDKGRTTSESIVKHYPPEAWDIYGTNYRILVNYFRRMGKSGISPEEATHAIVHALSTKQPKTRYYVGRDAKLFNFFNNFLQGRLRDWAIMRMIGLSDENEDSQRLHSVGDPR
ncbi:MAG: SDR family NAD(P)-dependent oxidoreductase [Chloroflexota bacterium]|nr:MAG: SDR family NAD(P)-dependent oxidoreductase [Chloroflexota bacterium]